MQQIKPNTTKRLSFVKSYMKNFLLLACEQAPKWCKGKGEKSSPKSRFSLFPARFSPSPYAPLLEPIHWLSVFAATLFSSRTSCEDGVLRAPLGPQLVFQPRWEVIFRKNCLVKQHNREKADHTSTRECHVPHANVRYHARTPPSHHADATFARSSIFCLIIPREKTEYSQPKQYSNCYYY